MQKRRLLYAQLYRMRYASHPPKLEHDAFVTVNKMRNRNWIDSTRAVIKETASNMYPASTAHGFMYEGETNERERLPLLRRHSFLGFNEAAEGTIGKG
jgi:hypothetical protein